MEIISHSNKEFQEWWDRILFRHLKNLANSPQLQRVSRGRCLAQSVITIFPSWIGLMNSHTCTPHCQSPLLDTSISMSCRSQITKLYSLCLFRAGRETKLIKNPTNPVKLFLLSLGFGWGVKEKKRAANSSKWHILLIGAIGCKHKKNQNTNQPTKQKSKFAIKSNGKNLMQLIIWVCFDCREHVHSALPQAFIC